MVLPVCSISKANPAAACAGKAELAFVSAVAADLFRSGWALKEVPSGAKALDFAGLFGTAKAVPFKSAHSCKPIRYGQSRAFKAPLRGYSEPLKRGSFEAPNSCTQL
jgi:hypothetical protein